jgi:predicted nucleic acid-binding protein
MIFADLLAGDAVFVDANVLTYHLQPHPRWGLACAQLLLRFDNRELSGYTSTHMLGELAHRLMTLEAMDAFGWPAAGIGNRLRQNPTEVSKLTRFRKAIDQILQSNLRVLTIDPPLFATAAALCQQFGLLTNDGLIVAVMQANGLTRLASNDADFDRVPGIARYAPA